MTTNYADERSLCRTVIFHYRAADEKRRLENLKANGHREPSPFTDFNILGVRAGLDRATGQP